MKRIPIDIIDSQSVSVGMSHAIIQAAQEAREGHSLEEIKAHVLDELSRTRILAVLDTLEFVKRGGRVGGAQAFLGNILSVKPIISLSNGVVVGVEQPRTRSKAYARVAQLLSQMGKPEAVLLAQSSDEVGQQLMQALKNIYQGEIPTYKLGAVLGTHTGPGTAAIAVVTEKK
jgi:DegV family protein with EDD domain